MKDDIRPSNYAKNRARQFIAREKALQVQRFAEMMEEWLQPVREKQRAVAGCLHTKTYLKVIPETEDDRGRVLDSEVQKRCANKACNALVEAS